MEGPTIQEQAIALLDRWDERQNGSIRYRHERFITMIGVLRRQCGDRPRVVDLGCGPGSLTRYVLEYVPDAQVVALDKDPVLLEITQDVFRGDDRVEVVEMDLEDPSSLQRLDGMFDAVMTSTASHWFSPASLVRLYYSIGGVIRAGGVFMNADRILYDGVLQPTFRGLADVDTRDHIESSFERGTPNWSEWWERIGLLPQYAVANQRRENVWSGREEAQPLNTSLSFHLSTLRDAGFREAATIFQYLDDWVVCAVR